MLIGIYNVRQVLSSPSTHERHLLVLSIFFIFIVLFIILFIFFVACLWHFKQPNIAWNDHQHERSTDSRLVRKAWIASAWLWESSRWEGLQRSCERDPTTIVQESAGGCGVRIPDEQVLSKVWECAAASEWR